VFKRLYIYSSFRKKNSGSKKARPALASSGRMAETTAQNRSAKEQTSALSISGGFLQPSSSPGLWPAYPLAVRLC